MQFFQKRLSLRGLTHKKTVKKLQIIKLNSNIISNLFYAFLLFYYYIYFHINMYIYLINLQSKVNLKYKNYLSM